jgi:hypothetical protein
MKSGRPVSKDPKVAAPIRLHKSVLDRIRSLGSVQAFCELAILDSLKKHDQFIQDKKYDTSSKIYDPSF